MPDDVAPGGAADSVPDPVSEWLAGVAEERGVSEEELLARLLGGDDPEADAAALLETVETLESAIEDLDERLDRQIQDVRDRVIQVKREADAKASADAQADLESRLDRLASDVGALGRDYVEVDDELVRLDDRLGALDDRLERGFANYEDVLEYLVETTDDVDRKLETLARAVVDLRERAERLAAADATRAATDRLRDAAAEDGITEASCEDCGETVHLGLLTSPSCPHCGTVFGDVEPKRGFFGSPTLRAGAQPALEGEVGGSPGDLDALLGAERDEAPSVLGHDEASETGAEATAQDTGPPADSSSDAPEEGVAADGSEPAPAAQASDGGPPVADGPAADAVDAITGIGSAYSDRLGAVGVQTVGDLALADPERLADATDIPADRIDEWVGRARQKVEAG